MDNGVTDSDVTVAGQTGATPDIDPGQFRTVLGQFPTGVAAITTIATDGSPQGMVAGTFVSVSLDPPLVAFFPDRKSNSLRIIRESGFFCANVLSADQIGIAGVLARKGDNKFQDLKWKPSPMVKAPLLDDAVAWIDCKVESITEAGDHFIVMGSVQGLGVLAEESLPLIFFRGGYGRFSSASLMSLDSSVLRSVELAREQMEELTAQFDMECLIQRKHGDEMAILASAGTVRVPGVMTRVGQRMPIAPPMGAMLVAWGSEKEAQRWIALGEAAGKDAEQLRGVLERVHERGWSLGLASDAQLNLDDANAAVSADLNEDKRRQALKEAIERIDVTDSEPAEWHDEVSIRSVAAPVFGRDGEVIFTISLYGVRDVSAVRLDQMRDAVKAAASVVTKRLVDLVA